MTKVDAGVLILLVAVLVYMSGVIRSAITKQTAVLNEINGRLAQHWQRDEQ